MRITQRDVECGGGVCGCVSPTRLHTRIVRIPHTALTSFVSCGVIKILKFRKYASDCLRKFVFERRRFRQFLSSLAEWCATFKEKGEEDGRRS